MKFRYKPKHLGKGDYCCRSCNQAFISGLNPGHEDNCPDKGEGWNIAVYNFGPNELKEIKEQGRSSNNSDLTIKQLEEIKII